MSPIPNREATAVPPSRRTGILAVIIVVSALLLSVVLADLVKPAPAHNDTLRFQSAATAPMAAMTTARSASATGVSHVSVAIQNYAFSPSALTISQGTTVTWTNHDTAPHTVTVSRGPVKFSSPMLQQGQSFSYTFTTAGTYAYYCAVHPDMTASVTVVAKAVPAPTTPTPAPTTPSTPPTMSMGGSSATSCGGVSAAGQAFLNHVYAGHLGESVSQQASDILNVNQYAKTHTVLVANMAAPVLQGLSDALSTFLTHVYTGHLGESASQQASDILNASQYVKTHTVLIGNMAQSIIGTPGC